MATTQECRAALDRLSGQLATASAKVRSAAALDRSVSCHLGDLDVTFAGRLRSGGIEVSDTLAGPHPGPERSDGHRQKAAIRLTMTSDDLVALVDGELNFAHAWATRRLTLNAGFRDLLTLRKLL
ncbi:sterol-binding protein [Streptomyces sp. NPDC058373]|uniref:sterol-binding protein n=1 Tax=Streptomyces sp. NPDC058373 TaxID=3346465 RepID=UPI003659EF0B